MINFKVVFALFVFINFPINIYANNKEMKIKLNPARFKETNLKVLLEKRKSCRDFQDKILNLDDIATVLWATCGKKEDALTGATRTIPSAGTTYPLELYLVVGRDGIDKVREGIYHYIIEEHSLELISEGDRRKKISDACLGQDFIAKAPASLVVTAKSNRTTDRYGTRGRQYVHMEVGHACQNTYLAVTNLGLGTVEVGAFVDEGVKEVMGLDKDTSPLIVMPIGYPQKSRWVE